MIDDLKVLGQILVDLPHIAVWAVMAFLFYKLSVLASLYGVIRFVVGRICDMFEANSPKITADHVSTYSVAASARVVKALRNFSNGAIDLHDADDIEEALQYYSKNKYKIKQELKDAEKSSK